MSSDPGALCAIGCCAAILTTAGFPACSREKEPVSSMKTGETDPVGEALKQAAALTAAGKYEEALEKHVWFHNHSLEAGPRYYGVRRSFALEYWVELGKKYPPALEKLKRIRDEKTTKILGGESSRELFSDVQSINRYLGQQEATVGLFKQVDALRPEFAEQAYVSADEDLIAAGEYELARKYLGDPFVRLEIARRSFESGMAYSRAQSDPTRAEKSRKAFESIFEADVLRIIRVWEKPAMQTWPTR